MTSPDASLVAQVGTTSAELVSVTLTAGLLNAEFEGGGLRYIRYGGEEVIRAISFLVRDENWGTYSLRLDDLNVQQTGEAFAVSFRGSCGPTGAELHVAARITGHADGRLNFTADATLHGELLTNRTGFVVLHPLAVSGKPVIVETIDGERRTTRFPELIEPHQPFRNVRALTTQHTVSISAEVRMEGDTFEMEDQRNWSDASFKTYVRPLELPWPYTLETGMTFMQSVNLRIREACAPAATGESIVPQARVALRRRTHGPAPRLGIGVRAADLRNALQHANALRQLAPAYFIGHLDLRHDDPVRAIAGFADLSGTSGVPYVLEAVLSGRSAPAEELAKLAEAVRKHVAPCALQVSPAPDLKGVLPGSPWPPCPSFDELFSAARAAFPDVPLGGGSFAYFTELNRKRPPAAQLDFVTFTTCPIVHAADDRSVMETLDTLPFIAATARIVFASTPYRVGPSAIATRDNPYGATTFPNDDGPRGRRICLTDNDPRQRALFAAAWNLGYFAGFAAGGATHIALSELTGPRGMFDGSRSTPLFHLFAALASSRGAAMIELTVERGTAPLAAFAVRHVDTVLWLANLAPDQQTVELVLPAGRATITRWNTEADLSTLQAPAAFADSHVALGPYETVEIRSEA
jgi:hypothetical protein